MVKAGIDLSDADLEQFIKAMDKDGDGVIDYEEWRDFLVVSQCPIAFYFCFCFCFCFCCTLCLSRRFFSPALTRFLFRRSLSTMGTGLYAGRANNHKNHEKLGLDRRERGFRKKARKRAMRGSRRKKRVDKRGRQEKTSSTEFYWHQDRRHLLLFVIDRFTKEKGGTKVKAD